MCVVCAGKIAVLAASRRPATSNLSSAAAGAQAKDASEASANADTSASAGAATVSRGQVDAGVSL